MTDAAGSTASPPLLVEPLTPFQNFEDASQAALRFLEDRLGFGLWLVTRTEGDDWIVLSAEDREYGVGSGDVFRWSDSFCYHMVQGRGPRVAPRSDEVSAYAQAPIGDEVPIRSYLGVPLTLSDGSLFGTLCAIDPEPQPAEVRGELPVVEMLARLLSTVLQQELHAQAAARRAERAEVSAERDPLTSLYNRRGWERLMAAEEERCQRYGNPAATLMIDLDELKEINDRDGHAAGDALLRRTAEVLRASCRKSDILARVGGDEFVVLAVETRPEEAEQLAVRLQEHLSEAHVRASIGWAPRRPGAGLEEALERADQHMYRDKRTRKPVAD